MELRVGDVIINSSIDSMERILWVNRKSDLLYSIDMKSKRLSIERYSIVEIERKIKNHEIYFSVNHNTGDLRGTDELSEAELKLLNKAWNTIKDIVKPENEPQIFECTYRGKLIKEIVDTGISSKAPIYKYLKKYWISGKVKNSLISNYSKCGGKGKEKKLGNKKVGRPNFISFIRPDKEGINVTEDIKRKFMSVIKRDYENGNLMSLRKVYDNMLCDYFSFFNEKTGEMEVRDSSKIPTYHQFRYFYYGKYRNIEREKKKKLGDKRFSLDHRELKSNTAFQSNAPGFRYEIDATISPFYLTNESKTGGVGKPTVYCVTDSFSKMIVGVHVSLGEASWKEAITAIYNCLEDKVEYCKRYDLNIRQEDWPNSGIPDNLLADRGEIKGPIAESAIENLGITIENTPSYRADLKGNVERCFGFLERELKAYLPGVIKKDFRERGGSDARIEAKMSLFEFTKAFLRAVIYNNTKILESYIPTKEMIEDDVSKIPCEIWSWGIENLGGRLRGIDDSIAKVNLMHRGIAKINEREIKFYGIGYECDFIRAQGCHIQARIQGIEEIEVLYDPRLMNNIYILDKNEMKLKTCYMKDEYEAFKGRSLYDIKEFIKNEKIKKHESINYINNTKLKLNMGLKHDVIEAERTYKEANNTNVDFRKDIKMNRNIEKNKISRYSNAAASHRDQIKTKEKEKERAIEFQNNLIDDILEIQNNEVWGE